VEVLNTHEAGKYSRMNASHVASGFQI